MNYDRRALERLLSFCVRDDNGCLIFTGTKNKKGYGQIRYRETMIGAHRLIMFLKGKLESLDSPLLVLHKNFICKSRACCEEEHLYVGNSSDNMHDALEKGTGISIKMRQKEKTHCPRGHLLEGDNLITRLNGYHRECRECHYMRQREYKRIKRLSSNY